ncbi:MAG: cysteine desulfurase-like protein [Homoserinimonas sp.]|nr:cysteine desulfurase-like protein [Homoserinimonas sp.]MCW5944418.1 cysteine desulfurase-like protein [Cryobacterium sp.]
MSYDVERIRADFPALKNGSAHFDGPGGTQTPIQVAEAVAKALREPLSNRGTVTVGESNAEGYVHAARQAIAALVGGKPEGVVFGRSATQLCYDFSRWISRDWKAGDEVVVTRLDHDSNIRPWAQAAERTGATVYWLNFDPETGELDPIESVLTEKTRLVAVTAASNLIGTRPPVAEISKAARSVGALTYVDGVHYTAHCLPDVEALGADFYSCSPYKFLGPHLGALHADPGLLESLWPDKLLPSTNVIPERFEFGTLPYELLAGVAAAVEYLADLNPAAGKDLRSRLVRSIEALEEHENELLADLQSKLAGLKGVTVHSRAQLRTPTLLLTFEGRDTMDAYKFLAARGVDAPSSNFYALEASRRLGLGSEGGLRVGLAPYTNSADINRLVEGLSAFLGS